MMRAVLISIQPPNTNNIFDGIKGIEWRTKPLPTGKHYCYETKKFFGLGKVIGEYHVWRVKRYENTSIIPENFIALGCVPIEFLKAYSKGRPLYAHFILRPKRYDKPRELSEFSKVGITKHCGWGECDLCGYGKFVNGEWKCTNRIARPPQSWCYVEEVHNGTENADRL